MFDKFGLIDKIITNVDGIADAKGAHKCALIIETIQQLSALRKGLQDEDAAAAAPVIMAVEPDAVANNGEAMEV